MERMMKVYYYGLKRENGEMMELFLCKVQSGENF